ncbi:hypothetical protein PLICRDRAFT_237254 [Plicaturopsis crispa FD-325 SS-3]|nr:hypothetical protein PLICRDRAFT_237254 [Plicaturopsis crispa FD-325 SS-3]
MRLHWFPLHCVLLKWLTFRLFPHAGFLCFPFLSSTRLSSLSLFILLSIYLSILGFYRRNRTTAICNFSQWLALSILQTTLPLMAVRCVSPRPTSVLYIAVGAKSLNSPGQVPPFFVSGLNPIKSHITTNIHLSTTIAFWR